MKRSAFNNVMSWTGPKKVTLLQRGVAKPDILRFRSAVKLWILSTIDLYDQYWNWCPKEWAPDYEREVISLLGILTEVDLNSLFKELKTLLTDFRNGEELGYASLQHSRFYPVIKTAHLNLPSVGAFKIIHHFLMFMSKFPVDCPELEEQLLLDFFKNDEINYDPLPQDVIDVKSILNEWFEGFNFSSNPAHGPGVIVTSAPYQQVGTDGLVRGNSLHLKYKQLGWDETLEVLAPPEWKDTYENIIRYFPARTFERYCSFISVPKNALAKRGICCENATNQFWQHALARDLDLQIQKSVSSHIDLHDQGKNQALCLIASKYGEFSTIDLSAASDSVHLRVITDCFPTVVGKALIATRSTHCILPDGTIHPLKKFAAMGSSCTFPVECLIFAALCETVARRHRLSFRERETSFVVYGDDIVIRNDLVADLLSLLNRFGFRVNPDKSFNRNTFRESCGVFAYRGEDITTPCIPRFFSNPEVSLKNSEQCDLLVSLANQLLLSGMLSARKYILSCLTQHGYKVPFVQFQESFISEVDPFNKSQVYSQFGVWSFYPVDNSHLAVRNEQQNFPARKSFGFFKWYRDITRIPPLSSGECFSIVVSARTIHKCSVQPCYQRSSYWVSASKTEKYKDLYPDDIRLVEWLRCADAHGRSRIDHSAPLGDLFVPITVPNGSRPRKRLRLRAYYP